MKKRISCFTAIGIIILLLSSLLCYATRPVDAQTPEPTLTPTPLPTATPTPNTVDWVDAGEGQHFRMERAITYGDIAVVIAVMALLLIVIIYTTFRIITHYLR